MKITFYDAKAYDKRTFAEANKSGHEITYVLARLTEESVHFAVEQGADAICTFVNCEVTKENIAVLKKAGIKLILQRSAGYNNVDLEAAKEVGIQVYRVPAYSPEGVAEFAMTLLTAINRNIQISYKRTTEKNFGLEGLEGETIFGETIGVLGAGRIGQAFIRIAKGFGARVVVYDPYAQEHFPDTATELGFEYVDKETVFKESDFVSLHLPSTPDTKNIVNKDTLALMKKHAIIVNTSRGDLVQTDDLLDALDYGRLRGAGLDVYQNEKGVFFFDRSNDLIPDIALNRLRAHRNVILTSHQAFFTNLALSQIAEKTMDNAEMFLKNDPSNSRLEIQEDGKVING